MPTRSKRACTKCLKAECTCTHQSPSKIRYPRAWYRCSKAYLSSNPLCEDCLAGINNNGKPRTTLAVECHHILKVRERPDMMFDHEWLMALCKQCHSIRTAAGE